MDAYNDKVEVEDVVFRTPKISDKKFLELSKEYGEFIAKKDKNMAKKIKRLHYRKDTGTKEGTIVPLAGGRVGGLALPVKKWKKNIRQTGRTKYTTMPIEYRDPWEDRFYVRTERSTELFCDKKWPRKLTDAEEREEAVNKMTETYADLNETWKHHKTGNSVQTSPRESSSRAGDPMRPASSPDVFSAAKVKQQQRVVSGPKAYSDEAYANPYAGDSVLDLVGDGQDPDPSFTLTQSKRESRALTGNSSSTGSLSELYRELYGHGTPDSEEVRRQETATSEAHFIQRMTTAKLEQQRANASMTKERFRSLSCAGLCDYMDRKGFQHYTDSFFERGVSGKDLLKCDEFDLAHIGMTFRPHRLKLLKLLDKFRGKDASTRRNLTKTLTSKALTQPLRPKMLSKDLGGYNLVVSPPKLTAAKKAELARLEVERLLNDQIATRNADLAAIEAIEIAKCLEEAMNLFMLSTKDVQETESSAKKEQGIEAAMTEKETAYKREQKETVRLAMEATYVHRQRLRMEHEAKSTALEEQKLHSRMNVIAAARMRARRNS